MQEWGRASSVQWLLFCQEADVWSQDAEDGSRAEGSRQPEKCLDSRTKSGSSLWGDSAVVHKERLRLSVVGLRPRLVPNSVRWNTRSTV